MKITIEEVKETQEYLDSEFGTPRLDITIEWDGNSMTRRDRYNAQETGELVAHILKTWIAPERDEKFVEMLS